MNPELNLNFSFVYNVKKDINPGELLQISITQLVD